MKVSSAAGIVLSASFLASGCASVPPAPEMPKDALAESLFVTQPWTRQPPVDIYRRVAAIQAAGTSAQQSLNTYTAALRAQAAQQTHYTRLQAQFRNSELAQRDLRARQLAEARAEAEAAKKLGKPVPARISVGGPPSPEDFALQLGIVTAKHMCGWRRELDRMRFNLEVEETVALTGDMNTLQTIQQTTERTRRNPCR